MTPVEVVGFAFALIVAGTETTTNLIGNAMLALAAFPDERRRFPPPIHRWRRPSSRKTFRYDSPVQGLARVTTRDVAIGDAVIPSGARVQLRSTARPNRDPERYADAGRFVIDRPAPPGIRHRAATRDPFLPGRRPCTA